MDVDLKFIPTDYGTMNYVIEEVTGGAAVGRLNYYDVPLAVGNDYTQTIASSSSFSDVASFPIQTSKSESISANEYLAATDETANVTISVISDEGGVATGAGAYPKGDSVELIAYPLSETYKFAGWYVDDFLVGIESVYRFTALDNVTVRASFEKRKTLNRSYEITLGASYEESSVVNAYNCADGTIAIVIGVQDADTANLESISMKKYDASGKCTSESNLETSFDNHASYWLYDLSFAGSAKAELYDSEAVCIASIVVTGETDAMSGDTNGDGKLNTRDVVLLQKYLSGWDVEIVLDAADTNGDGKVNTRDVVLLQRYLSGWDVTLGPAQLQSVSTEYQEDFDTEPARIVVESQSVHTGEEITIPVTFEDHPGLVAYRFGVAYDSEKLELLRVQDGDFENIPAPIDSNPYILNWADGSNGNATGTVAGLLTFRVKEDAVGKANISIVIEDPDEFFSADDAMIPFDVVNGEVDILPNQTARQKDVLVSIREIDINEGKATVTIDGDPGTDSKLLVAAYASEKRLAGVASCKADKEGQYTVTLNTTGADVFTAFLTDSGGKPIYTKQEQLTA